MVYITGDIHGDLSFFSNPKLKKLTRKDTLIVCGDFGFLWGNSEEEKKAIKVLKRKKYIICFVDGAHENFDILNSYSPYRYKGGNTHKIADNIYHLMRGEIFMFDGYKFFCMGGGESEDIEMREEGETWWKNEMPSAKEYYNGARNLRDFDDQIDYIITHEPPAKAKDFINLHSKKNANITHLNTYLEKLMEQVSYRHWFFGSVHEDIPISTKMTAVYNDIICIE